jgi:hypothetical protein
MIHCENCRYYTEKFDIDDWTGEYFDFCECSAYCEPIDDTNKTDCPEYIALG